MKKGGFRRGLLLHKNETVRSLRRSRLGVLGLPHPSEFMHYWCGIADSLGDIEHMAVVGEIDSPSRAADPCHDTAGGAGSFFVEGFENVVAEER